MFGLLSMILMAAVYVHTSTYVSPYMSDTHAYVRTYIHTYLLICSYPHRCIWAVPWMHLAQDGLDRPGAPLCRGPCTALLGLSKNNIAAYMRV